MPWLKMRDEWTVRLKDLHAKEPHMLNLKDSSSESGKSLLVYTAATHAGIVTGNYRFYRPDLMMDSAHTWIPVKAYPRPVLIGHDEEGVPLGRVLKARYVDTSYEYLGDFPIIKDSTFYKHGADKHMGLFESVDWIVDNLQGLDDYTGLGYIELGLKITNPDAIEKVLRDEYLTVSVGFRTDSAVCSVCHTDWAREDRCQHKMGEDVDGKQMFLISGNFEYEEVSFVNFPADPFAGTVSKERLADNLEKIFFLGLSTKKQKALKVGTRMTDSLYSSDIHFEEPMANTVVDVKTIDAAAFNAEIRGEKLTPERALELKATLQGWSPEKEEDKTAKRSLVSTLNAKIRKNAWEKKPGADDKTTPEVEAAISQDSSKKTDGACICDNPPTNGDPCDCSNEGEWDLNDEDKEYFSDVDGIYAELELEIDAAITAGELTADSAKDAKLSSEKRNGLKGSSFCGPNRSFPVEDCAHVTAARRLIGRAKVSEATKSRILACVSRKASSLGCGSKKDAVATDAKLPFISQFFDAVSTDINKEGVAPGEIIAHYEGLHGQYDKANDEIRSKMRGLHYAVGEHWGAKSMEAHYKNRLEAKDSIGDVAVELGFADGKNSKLASLLMQLDELFTSSDDAGKDAVATAAAAIVKKSNSTKFVVCEATDVVISKQELEDKETALNEVEDANSKLLSVQKQLLDSYKRSLATQIVISHTLQGTDGFKALSVADRQAKVDQLSKRHVQSLKDSVADIMTALKWPDVTSATRTDKVTEPGHTVNDNAQVTEQGSVTDTTVTQPSQEEADAARTFWDSLKYMTAQERTQFLLSRQYDSTAVSAQS